MALEKHEFKTEMAQMMDIIINSLYSNQDIFLRELLSNASDAIDKIRFEAISNDELLEGDSEWKIKISVDKDAGTMTISDNGVGMDMDSVKENLGTLAKSGTGEFLKKLQEAEAKDQPELIGQFGLGFYSSFMVADKVEVITRMAGDKAGGVKWISDGKGGYTVEQVEKEKRGTDIILYMKDDSKNHLDEWSIRSKVKSYSDFIEHAIVMDVERTVPVESSDSDSDGDKDQDNKTDDKDKKDDKPQETKTVIEEETLNSREAIWRKSKSSVTEEEYNKFYKHISRDFEDPAKAIHYSAEGTIEFKALLYLPKKRPFDFLMPERKNGLHLYIKRVFIMDDCKDLLPPYLRFVQGVVDASDLPLNVSREMLQDNPLVDKIRKNLVSKVLSAMKELKGEDKDAYLEFYKQFGVVIKEGLYTDFANKEKLSDLLMFESSDTEAGKYITLREYVDAMPEDQDEIYYLIGESRSMLESSPYLESIKDRGFNTLFMTDPVDEWMAQSLAEYDGKKLKAIDKGEVKADEEGEKKVKEQSEEYKDMLEYLNSKIEEVKEVRLSSRLKKSAACLVAEEGQMGAYVESVLKKISAEGDFQKSARILELNGEHVIVKGLQKLYAENKEDERITEYGRLLYDQAVLSEGSKLQDPHAFAERMNKILMRDFV